MFFNPDQIKQLTEDYSKVDGEYKELLLKFTTLKLNNQDAHEYAYHGFTRRIGTLKRCIDNVYTICPSDQSEKLSKDELLDLRINLQSFVVNVFGCIDNLAWVWAKERKLTNEEGKLLSRGEIGLMSRKANKIIRNNFSKEFRHYLGSHKKWYENLKDFRDTLAHRIPLYVPPYGITLEKTEQSNALEIQMREALERGNFQKYDELSAEQDDLGHFLPLMAHSSTENSNRVVFHAQILADWNTIVEMSEKFLEELDKT